MKKLFYILLLAMPVAAAPITTVEGTWTDTNRSREIPYKIYAPANPTGMCPIIIFSHGLGGTREGYAYLGSFWASNGYISIHLQHHGSDDAAWRGAKDPMRDMQRAAANPMNAIDRPRDVSFAIDRLASLETNELLHGRIDTNRIGIAGHSFGGFTTLASAGQKFGPRGVSLGDHRIKAAIAMSAPVPRANKTEGYAGIHIPVMHMTGTADDSPIGDTKAAERRVPFDNIRGVDQFFVNFTGGDHMIFSGIRRPEKVTGGAPSQRTARPDAAAFWEKHLQGGDASKDAVFQRLIQTGTLAFWDSYLRDDVRAKDWLQKGGYAKELGDFATYETRSQSDAKNAGKAN